MGKHQWKSHSAALILATLWMGVASAETPAPADLAQEETFLDVLPKIDVKSRQIYRDVVDALFKIAVIAGIAAGI